MIKKTHTDHQIVDLMIQRRLNVVSALLEARINSVFSQRTNQTFKTNAGAFGEFQQGTSVGFCRHYTRRS